MKYWYKESERKRSKKKKRTKGIVIAFNTSFVYDRAGNFKFYCSTDAIYFSAKRFKVSTFFM
jgi:hypothetical protein